MVIVNLRNKNNLITLSVDGKAPIRGRTANNLYFHTPLELLLSSLGLCVGGIIINYCRLNDLNSFIFESISIYKDGNYIIKISYPSEIEKVHINRISTEIENCSISNELKEKVLVKWELNETPTDVLIKEETKLCCGG